MTHSIGINFHGVGTPEYPLDPGEADYWLSIDQFEYVLDQIAAAPDPNAFTITFDDGNPSDHDVALPALIARGLKARFFVLTGRIGHARSLDKGQLRAMRDAGMMIGSHGIDHVVWPELDDAALTEELRTSRAQLEQICGARITEAGIPFGRYDVRVLQALRDSGYATAWSSDGGVYRQNTFLRPRTSLRGDMTRDEMQVILAGRMPPLRRLRRAIGMMRRRWTVTG